jgi:hypothetical protein
MARAVVAWSDASSVNGRHDMVHLDILEHQGAMYWRPGQRAWSVDPAEVVKALQQGLAT